MGFKKSPSYKYINFAVSFGLTLAITVFVMYKGGTWLDERLGTEPIFMMIGIVLAVATVFKRLLADVKTLDKDYPYDDNKE